MLIAANPAHHKAVIAPTTLTPLLGGAIAGGPPIERYLASFMVRRLLSSRRTVPRRRDLHAFSHQSSFRLTCARDARPSLAWGGSSACVVERPAQRRRGGRAALRTAEYQRSPSRHPRPPRCWLR